MVTIRNDIEANGNVNRPTETATSVTGVVDNVKNVNHLANGSRRSTMGDIKPKAFNRKCVGFLTLIVCVGVCFSVGMLFLYGHLVDRLNESAKNGTMLHDKYGNPVMHISTTTASPASTTTVAATSPKPVNIPTITSTPVTTEDYNEVSKGEKESAFDLDSTVEGTRGSDETVIRTTTARVQDISRDAPSSPFDTADIIQYSDDDDDDEASGSGDSGSGDETSFSRRSSSRRRKARGSFHSGSGDHK